RRKLRRASAMPRVFLQVVFPIQKGKIYGTRKINLRGTVVDRERELCASGTSSASRKAGACRLVSYVANDGIVSLQRPVPPRPETALPVSSEAVPTGPAPLAAISLSLTGALPNRTPIPVKSGSYGITWLRTPTATHVM